MKKIKKSISNYIIEVKKLNVTTKCTIKVII